MDWLDSIRWDRDGLVPAIGESMYFEAMGRDLVTSAIVSVERPPAETITHYPGTLS